MEDFRNSPQYNGYSILGTEWGDLVDEDETGLSKANRDDRDGHPLNEVKRYKRDGDGGYSDVSYREWVSRGRLSDPEMFVTGALYDPEEDFWEEEELVEDPGEITDFIKERYGCLWDDEELESLSEDEKVEGAELGNSEEDSGLEEYENMPSREGSRKNAAREDCPNSPDYITRTENRQGMKENILKQNRKNWKLDRREQRETRAAEKEELLRSTTSSRVDVDREQEEQQIKSPTTVRKVTTKKKIKEVLDGSVKIAG